MSLEYQWDRDEYREKIRWERETLLISRRKYLKNGQNKKILIFFFKYNTSLSS